MKFFKSKLTLIAIACSLCSFTQLTVAETSAFQNELLYQAQLAHVTQYAQNTATAQPASTTGANTSLTLAPGTDATAQAAGQAFLDSVPLFSIFTNLPTATFDQAKLEIFLGLQNDGAQIENAVDAHWNFRTNFFALGEFTLGATPNILNSIHGGLGWRHAWTLWEIYGYGAVGRDIQNSIWDGRLAGGAAWKLSSAFAGFFEFGPKVTEKTITNKGKDIGSFTVQTGIVIPTR